VHEWHDFLSAVIESRPVPPHQATFEDGYQAAVICDAILTSARIGRRVSIEELTSESGSAAAVQP
jgi:predicted dehydrogenase